MWNNTFLEFKRRIEVGILWNQIPGLNVKRNFGWSGWIRWCQISRFVSHTCIDYSWDWIEILMYLVHSLIISKNAMRSYLSPWSLDPFHSLASEYFLFIHLFIFLHSLNFMTSTAPWYPSLDSFIRSWIRSIMQFMRKRKLLNFGLVRIII